MPTDRVKYGTSITKTLICKKCNDGSCEVKMIRDVVKNRQTTDDFDAPKWIVEKRCIYNSFIDAEWIELKEEK